MCSGGGQKGTDTVAPRDQAESVAEAIIRHQNLCTVGKITTVGQLLQLVTIFGMCLELILQDTELEYKLKVKERWERGRQLEA